MTTSTASSTPPGEDAPAAGMTPALNQDEAISTEHLLDAVLSFDNLAQAWQRVKSNKGAPGTGCPQAAKQRNGRPAPVPCPSAAAHEGFYAWRRAFSSGKIALIVMAATRLSSLINTTS